MSLADHACIPCRGGVPPLPRERVEKLLTELEPGWTATHDGTRIERTFQFKDLSSRSQTVHPQDAFEDAAIQNIKRHMETHA